MYCICIVICVYLNVYKKLFHTKRLNITIGFENSHIFSIFVSNITTLELNCINQKICNYNRKKQPRLSFPTTSIATATTVFIYHRTATAVFMYYRTATATTVFIHHRTGTAIFMYHKTDGKNTAFLNLTADPSSSI